MTHNFYVIEGKISIEKELLLQSLVDFFFNKYYIRTENVELVFIFDNFLDFGGCYGEDYSYIIEVNKDLNDSETIKTIFHELFHVYQNIYGLHREKNEENVELFRLTDREKEAYKAEHRLYTEYVRVR